MSGKNRLTGAVAGQANKLLPKVAALFKKHGIRYCLDGGTLLGIVREDRLLPWDDDLDFFVPADQSNKISALKFRLLLLGCRLKKSSAKGAYGPIQQGAPRIYKIKSIRRKNGQRVVIDLIFKHHDETDFHWVVGVNPPVHKKINRKYYDNFDEIVYRGVSYPIPCDVENYLTERYGDWRVTKKEWNFRTDDLAVNR